MDFSLEQMDPMAMSLPLPKNCSITYPPCLLLSKQAPPVDTSTRDLTLPLHPSPRHSSIGLRSKARAGPDPLPHRIAALAKAPQPFSRPMCTTSPFPQDHNEVPDPPIVKAVWIGGVGGTTLLFAGGIVIGQNTLLPAWAFFHGAGATASALKSNLFETAMHAAMCE